MHEQQRLAEAKQGTAAWRKWGPYLSERQWGTVREDYSPAGDAWEYFTHDQARSRAYRWGEDGLAGFSDEQARLCLSLALWNGKDAILKERLFGLTNGEGNHGEDVKEIYYYLDATPTHSYLKMLYKYPQQVFPYEQLVAENKARGKTAPEYELLETGLFDDNRYFDVFVEYAKASPDDILMQITAHNRGAAAAMLHLLPQLWFRNNWTWQPAKDKPRLQLGRGGAVEVQHPAFPKYRWSCAVPATALFCENETNEPLLFGTAGTGPFKDGFHEYVIRQQADAVASTGTGTKAAFHFTAEIPAGGSVVLKLRLGNNPAENLFADFDHVFELRRREADDFYAGLQAELPSADARLVQRQAFAGMIWSKQFYYFDIPKWLDGDPLEPAPPVERQHGRNRDWRHLNNADVISMPDKWEYPWYAAWDLAFHCLPLAVIDAEFAKSQLVLLTRDWYMHPNGELPAYEWNFGDVNPPVHAWATWRVFQIDRKQQGGAGDLFFLERVFHKLMLNFTWWVNRKDQGGQNIFQGGFLGLDNIGIFDRNVSLPGAGYLNQADGTSWMAMYALNMMRIALELALHNKVYEDLASKFFEHFLQIAEAITNCGEEAGGLWDDEDKFYYDEVRFTNGEVAKLKIRSMVGLIPLFAVETLEPALLDQLPEFRKRLLWFLKNRPRMAELVSRWEAPGIGERRLLSLLRGHRMKAILRRMLDESEFLSEYGVRALSRVYAEEPYRWSYNQRDFEVRYQPAESDSRMFGGNSNWRGPLWFPVNYLIIESLQKFHHYYGNDFQIECPTGSGQYLTIDGVAQELTRRLTRIFLRDDQGRRAVFGDQTKFQNDPHFRDYILFYEYFHGDNAAGLGAAHQTGWTGLIAKLLQPHHDGSKGG